MIESLLAEHPAITSLMLGALAFGMIYGWMQNGNKTVCISGFVCIGLIPFAWLIANRWETDAEQIEAVIYRIADAVEANDHETAVSVIADPSTRSQASAELQRYIFDLADVNKIRSIQVIEGSFPLEADVDMSVKVDVREVRGAQTFRVPRRLILRFVKKGDEWFVTDYQHMPITGGPDRYSTNTNTAP
ncbi:MAG: hypothetical protein AAGG48_28155 [Planctomycetota bacterium]